MRFAQTHLHRSAAVLGIGLAVTCGTLTPAHASTSGPANPQTTVAAQATSTAVAPSVTGWDRCPSGRMCVFTGLHGTGTIGIFRSGDANLGDSNGPSGLNNNIESVWDRNGEEWCLFNDPGYEGGITLVKDGAKGNINPPRYRNITSSLKPCRA